MSKRATFITYFLIITYIVLQTLASSTEVSLYPLNPYRMFSRHWENGIKFGDIKIVDDRGLIYRTWDVLETPFFQANRVIYNTYVRGKEKSAKEMLCRHALQRIGGENINFVGRALQFKKREAGGVLVSQVHTEVLFKCGDS